jgi:MOSC domain-containing protein YiiM
MSEERTFQIVSLNVSQAKGTIKTPVDFFDLVEGSGVSGDAHAESGDRQVSLLALEDIETMKAAGANVKPGDFAENITTKGIDLPLLPLGTQFKIGQAVLELSKIGKECHTGCAIRQAVGDCVMPRRGVFARVVRSGRVSREDSGTYRI